MTSPQSSSSCGMSPQDLQRAFDGEAGAGDMASHVAVCPPCSSALELLKTQRDAVQYLSEPGGERPPQVAVEHILARSARAGREKLADLLYEMAKACLIVLPDLKRRVERRVEPREAPVVSSELRAINSRLDDADAAVDVTAVPQTAPDEQRALAVARSCLTILENVEGKSERHSLGTSQLLIFEERPDEAERIIRQLIDSGVPLEHSNYAYRNLSHSLLRQGNYSEAATVGRSAMVDCPADGMLLLNTAVACAHLQEHDEFAQYAKKIRRLIEDGSIGWVHDLIRFEVPRLAADLAVPEEEVRSLLGVGSGTDGVIA